MARKRIVVKEGLYVVGAAYLAGFRRVTKTGKCFPISFRKKRIETIGYTKPTRSFILTLGVPRLERDFISRVYFQGVGWLDTKDAIFEITLIGATWRWPGKPAGKWNGKGKRRVILEYAK